MFSIFQKKEFLIDHLSGITDIHNHILPGIDDGAKSVEESIGLLKKFKEMGIEKFICTPHIMNDFYPNTPEIISNALHKLKREIKNYRGLHNMQIRAAAEYMMDQSFLDHLKNEKLMVLKENMVLVEMSYFQAPINLNEILFKLRTKGYKPVLAHPERYSFFHSKDLRKYQDLKNRGCLFQLNSLSLTPHYGQHVQKIAYKLLQNDMIDFLGSDTHREQHIQKLTTLQFPKKLLTPLVRAVEITNANF
jgi:protein-tyrosine phosphatase